MNKVMAAFITVLLFGVSPAARAEFVAKDQILSGSDVKISRSPSEVSVTAAAGSSATVFLAEQSSPGITAAIYVVKGEIRYEGVEGEGYLELWNVFSPQQRYFSRSLAEEGPFRKLSGTSGWREFILPFDATGATGTVQKLELNLVLPKGGSVSVRNLHVEQFPHLATAATTMPARGEWWSPDQANLWGGIGGGILGLLGAMMGVLASRFPRVVQSGAMVLAVVGFVLALAGSTAYFGGQPWDVYFPLILTGGILLVVCVNVVFLLGRRMRAEELRKIALTDWSG